MTGCQPCVLRGSGYRREPVFLGQERIDESVRVVRYSETRHQTRAAVVTSDHPRTNAEGGDALPHAELHGGLDATLHDPVIRHHRV